MRPSAAVRVGVAACWIALAGCYSPSITDGTLACTSDDRCPRGFVCRTDRRCYATGADASPDVGTEARPTDAGTAGVGGPGGAAGSVGSGRGGGAGAMGGMAGMTTIGGAGTSGLAGTSGSAGTGGGAGTTGRGGTSGAAGSGKGGGGGTTGGAGASGSAGTGRGGTTGGAGTTGAAGGAGTSGAAGTGGSPGAGLGSTCNAGTQCASGFCVDGLCCNELCADKCRACDVGTSRGTCTQVASGPPHGTRGTCAGTGSCAGACSAASATACTYPGADVTCRDPSCAGATLTLRAGCNGAGACPAVATMSCGDLACSANGMACLAACTADAHCATAARPYCEAGACVAGRSNGAACQSTRECTSGRCADGVCCNDACGGSCQACDVQGHVGTCWPVSGATPHGGRPACGGSGVCAGYCNGLASGQCYFPGAETSCPCGVLGGTCNQAGACQTLADICL